MSRSPMLYRLDLLFWGLVFVLFLDLDLGLIRYIRIWGKCSVGGCVKDC